jgi:alpha-N-arabinofuranosidase
MPTESVMARQSFVALLFVGVVGFTQVAGPTIVIDASAPSGKVSPLFYGLMTEEINHSYDGGLYAELLQNRAFLDNPQSPLHWSVVQSNDSAASIALDRSEPLNTAIGTSLRLEVTKASTAHRAGVANDGYWGIPVKPDTRYRASLYAKAAPGFTGPIELSIQRNDGQTTYASGKIAGLTQSWKQYELTLQTRGVAPTTATRYVLTVDRPAKAWLSVVSLFPPTFRDQPNGFRPDIMQMMVDMKPKFLRFPGGNYLEGDQTRIDSSGRRRWARSRIARGIKRRGPIAPRTASVSTNTSSGART